MTNDRTYSELIEAYNHIKNSRNNFGYLRKSIFHVHTPESKDYKLFGENNTNGYKYAKEEELEDYVYKEGIIPSVNGNRLDKFGDEFNKFKNRKEIYAFLILAHELLINEYEIVVVTDHNTFEGVDKLKICIKHLSKNKEKYKVNAIIFCGIEISCADKLHVVAIIDDNKEIEEKANSWLKDKLMTEEGVYVTSLDVMEYFYCLGAITYIAHISSSNITHEDFLSGVYKKKLFSSEYTKVVGVKSKDKIKKTKSNLRIYRKDIKFLIDNDSHSIDTLKNNYFWIRGSDISFQMLKEAIIDFDIAISYDTPVKNKVYIKGLYIMYEKDGFLVDKRSRKRPEKEGFTLKFSDSLNCLIGGRGTGKSTVLEIIDFVMTQNARREELDFICKHGNIYILFELDGKEYFVEYLNPTKDVDENIMAYFEDDYTDVYKKYYFNQRKVKEKMLKEYLKVYCVNSDNISKIKETDFVPVRCKSDIISKLYNNRYSVNELVNTAKGEEINQFIYDTMIQNENIKAFDEEVNFRSRKGLKRFIENIETTLDDRLKSIMDILNPFNAEQEDVFKIEYTQKDFSMVDNIDNLYNKKFLDTSKKYNIKSENLNYFLDHLINNVGVISFLKSSFGLNDLNYNYNNLLEFAEEESFGTVESDKINITKENVKSITEDLVAYATSVDNIAFWNSYFKNNFKKIEKFTISFNVNSKEGKNRSNRIYKDIRNLSLGQKVVAMLDFILAYGKYKDDYRPLVIDQPEDNLDSRYVYKNLVKHLRDTKNERQVIIATHNATIVTNAVSDCVIVMESDGKHGWIKNQGYPGERAIKREILVHLEGGIESFKHKMKIYEEVLKEN